MDSAGPYTLVITLHYQPSVLVYRYPISHMTALYPYIHVASTVAPYAHAIIYMLSEELTKAIRVKKNSAAQQLTARAKALSVHVMALLSGCHRFIQATHSHSV